MLKDTNDIKPGRLIVLDGLDGSGKSTQFELLSKRLSDKPLKAISFPDYDKPSSALVKMYLAGEFSGDANAVNAYAASSFYAVDRYASFKLYWEREYLSGVTVLASRYVSSNAIHQMTKLDEREWDGYLAWLEDYEYDRLGLPRPDSVLLLDMPVEISQKLLSKRYCGDETKKDIHEGNINYLHRCRKAALYAADKLGWTVIRCYDGDEPLTVETIADMIFNEVKE